VTRDQHLEWAKKRALKYVDDGDFMEAITSMGSDLTKHEELRNHPGIQIGIGLLAVGALSSDRDARRFIEGFN
jgi:hypothetical protein